MSTRYMKKVYGGDEALDKGDASDRDVENPVGGGVRRKQFNVFDLVSVVSTNDTI